MTEAITLFIYWQDPDSRRWHVVGRLSRTDDLYRFVYTKGALQSKRFIPFGRMTDLHGEYQSRELFPLFANRVLQPSRPEYADYLKWLAVDQLKPDPLMLLARTGGTKVTDSIAIYAQPSPDAEGRYRVMFFCHGVRYVLEHALQRIDALSAGDPLYPMHDMQNPWDKQALAVRTDDPAALVGYCPRYFAKDFRALIRKRPREARLTVARVNHRAPLQYRLLCEFRSPWPEDFRACQDREYQPLAPRSAHEKKSATVVGLRRVRSA